MRFQFDSFLTKKSDFNIKFNKGSHVPMRVMFGKIIKQTDKCYYIEVYGKPEPATHCLHCMRKLTHKVSMYYGLGPICGKHYYISGITEENLEEHFDDIRAKMAQIVWKGLVPKKSVKVDFETFHTIEFLYNGTTYRTTTSDQTKVKQIKDKCDAYFFENIRQG